MSESFENDPEFNDATSKPRAECRVTVGQLLRIVAVIAVLIGYFLLAMGDPCRVPDRVPCANNLRQIGLALHSYEQNHGALPLAYTVDANGKPLHSWRTLILPYLDQEALYRTIDLSKPWNDPVNATVLGTSLAVFHCFGWASPPNETTYLAIVSPSGCLIPKEPRCLAEITDAHDLTLMLIEAGEEHAVPWMAPVDADEQLVLRLGLTTKLPHAGGMNACFVDGSTLFLKADTPARVRRALISIDGGDDDVARER